MTDFNPQDHLIKIKTKQGEKEFLKATSALNWFYDEHPLGDGRITTKIVNVDKLIICAEIWVGGAVVATGHADPDGDTTKTLKKIETAAIRRALANAGYGTDQVLSRLAKSIGVEEAKRMLGSGKSEGERRMGQGHKPADLEAWALNAVYDGNEYHMKASIQKLVNAGKLHKNLSLEEAKAVVTSRHAEEAKENVRQAQEV